jgi:hypothetical protein
MAKPARRLKVAAPERSPERDALAAAIARHVAAIARLEAIEAALEGIFAHTAREAVAAAAEAVEDAKTRAARALFEKTTGPTVAEARAAHAAAQDALAAAESARDALEAEAEAARGEITMSRVRLDMAVADAVRADPATARLVARWREVQREHADLRSAVQLLEGGPVPAGVTALRDFPDLQLADRRRDAVPVDAVSNEVVEGHRQLGVFLAPMARVFDLEAVEHAPARQREHPVGWRVQHLDQARGKRPFDLADSPMTGAAGAHRSSPAIASSATPNGPVARPRPSRMRLRRMTSTGTPHWSAIEQTTAASFALVSA